MKSKLQHFSRAGLTITEMLITLGVMGIVLAGVMIFLNTGMLAFAKNISTNSSHNTMRAALDRLGNSMNAAAGQPTLVSATGTTVASGSAAGIKFDEFIGGPYIVAHPGGAGISATATTITVTRSVHALASPRAPKAGDVLLIDGSTVRLKVGSVSSGAVDGSNRQTHTITLSSAPGTAISWVNTTTKIGNLMRPVAFVVVPSGTRNQLRHYPSAEAITNYSTAATSTYELICDNIGTGTGDTTPFSLSTVTDYGDRKLLDVALRVRARQFDQRLAWKEQSHFSSAIQLNVSFAPKGS